MVYLHGIEWGWYHSDGAFFWQQSICWTFILLSGFCWSMGKNHLKNGLMVFGGGLLVSAITLLFMPGNRILFGVLTCIGSCILLLIPLKRLLKRIPPWGGAVGSFGLFVLTRGINRGYLGWGGFRVVSLPDDWYRGWLGAYLGFTPPDFYSTDYFSLFPWFFLFLTGYFAYCFCKGRNLLEKKVFGVKIPGLEWMGKHSLLIYLLHQPILYLLGSLLL